MTRTQIFHRARRQDTRLIRDLILTIAIGILGPAGIILVMVHSDKIDRVLSMIVKAIIR